MKLNRLKLKSGNMFSVTLEGCPPMILEDISVYRLGLKEGMEISEELFEEICTTSGREGAKYAATRLLAAGRKTKSELKQRLRQKGFSSEDIDSATETFVNIGIVDDRSYAEMFVKDAVNLKKYSVRQIKQKLALKGIDREIIGEVMLEIDDFTQLYAIIESELSKSPDNNGLEKLKRRLYSKGFSLWDINKVLGEYEYET